MVKSDPPNPGSDEALEKGCRCPVIDNHHGKGFCNGWFYVSGDCPVHGKGWLPPVKTLEEEKR